MNRRTQKRLSKSAAVYIPIGAFLIILLTLFGISGFLRIVEIEVDGSASYTKDEIISVSGISTGDNLLFIDANAAAKRIELAMPFINGATVTRVPPGIVRIEISESTALAYVAVFDEVLVIDSTGRVLQRGVFTPEGLIEIRGFTPGEVTEGTRLRAVQGGEYQLDILMDVLAAFEKESMEGYVSYLDVTYITQIEFDYRLNYKIVLGGPNNLRQKLTSLPIAIADVEETYSKDVTGTLKAEQDGKWRWVSDN